MCKYKIIDLFSGAGGLSYGFLQTKKFKICMAVEINKSAQETYRLNHNNKNIEIRDDIVKIDFKEVKNKYGNIDFIIGGPPCQGFSNANRQRNTLISNNNKLVKEYIRAIEDIKPKGFVLENVKTMDSKKHRFYLSNKDMHDSIIKAMPKMEEVIEIADLDDLTQIIVEILYLNITKDNIDEYLLDKKTITFVKNISKSKKLREYLKKNKQLWNIEQEEWINKHTSYFCDRYKELFIQLYDSIFNFIDEEKDNIIRLSSSILNSQNLLHKYKELLDNDIIFNKFIIEDEKIKVKLVSYNIFSYVKEKLDSLGYDTEHFILNAADYGVAQQRKRLILIGIKKEILKKRKIEAPKPIVTNNNYMTIKNAIKDLQEYKYVYEIDKDNGIQRNEEATNKLAKYLSDCDVVKNMVITNTGKVALERFKKLKQGENFHDLDEKFKSTYSNPERTQSSIYKRLNYDEPSGTVTNIRKAMWIHPVKNRALSIREAARLQSFPDSFVFVGTKDSQYQQIGNAVPPMMARVIAETVLELIGDKPNTKYLREIILE